MGRGIVFGLVMWFIISSAIFVYSHLTGDEKSSVAKSVRYGFITAVIAGLVVLGVVFVF